MKKIEQDEAMIRERLKRDTPSRPTFIAKEVKALLYIIDQLRKKQEHLVQANRDQEGTIQGMLDARGNKTR